MKVKTDPVIRLKEQVMEKSISNNKMDTVIKNLIEDAEDHTIDKLFNIINEKLKEENISINSPNVWEEVPVALFYECDSSRFGALFRKLHRMVHPQGYLCKTTARAVGCRNS